MNSELVRHAVILVWKCLNKTPYTNVYGHFTVNEHNINTKNKKQSTNDDEGEIRVYEK